jgi:hypothetical protein
MSDTIDATTSLAAPPPAAAATAGATARDPAAEDHIATADLVRIAQGFYAIFWGLLVAVLSAVQLITAWYAPPLTKLVLAAAAAAIVAGSWRLRQAPLASVRPDEARTLWRRRTRLAMGLAWALLYFAALFCLWVRARTTWYLMANAAAFGVVLIGYTIAVNRAVTALARVLGRRQLALESQVFSATNIGLLFLPVVMAVLYVFTTSLVKQTNPLTELLYLLGLLGGGANLLLVLVLLLPFSLTLALIWTMKDAVLRRLAEPDAASSPPT